jgi:hypothetical protein
MSRRQAPDALAMRLMSTSIAATAVMMAVRGNQSAPCGGEAGDPLACFESLLDEGRRERTRESDPNTTARPRIWFSKVTRWDQLLARDDEQADGVGGQRLHVHGLKDASARQVRKPSFVVAIGLVRRKRLERLTPAGFRRRPQEGRAGSARGTGSAPVSNTIRRQVGAFANFSAITSAVDTDVPS